MNKLNSLQNKSKNTRKNTKQKKPKPLTPMDIMKLEIADELGLMDKVKSQGWAGLTAAETGRIGGLMTAKIKKNKKEQAN